MTILFNDKSCFTLGVVCAGSQARQMCCWASREENITGSWWTLVACWLIAVAAWVRRLPSRGSKSSVVTWWAQWEQVNFMPPLMRPMV